MLAPGIIEKIKKDKRERRDEERPAVQIPLSEPCIRHPHEPIEHEEKTDRVIVIELA